MKIISSLIKYIVIVFTILFITFILWAFLFAINFHGDSYSNSEKYIINTNIDDLKDKINSFKSTNTEFYFMNTNEKGEKYLVLDKIDENVANNYFVYFYLKDKNLALTCILNFKTKNETILKFYCISQGSRFATWQRINTKEVDSKENKQIKDEFEKEVLNKLNIKWKHKHWYNW